MKKIIYFLFIIFALGFTLRLLGISYGLPYLSHPDEARVILDTLSMGHRFSLLPFRPDYALIYRYFLLFIYGLYYLIGKVFNLFSGPYDFALKFLINPTNIYLISRFLSVLFGSLIAIPAYLIGEKIFQSEKIGVVSFIFVIFEFQLLQHSQWTLYPIFLSFFSLVVFYFIFRVIKKPTRGNFIFCGLFCGLAISVQNQGIFLIPPLIMAYILIFKLNIREIRLKLFFELVFISLSCLALFSLLGNLYWLFIFKKSLAKTLELWGVTRVGFSSAPPYSYNIISMFTWFITELIRQDLLLGIIMVFGLVYSIWRRKPYDYIFISFIIPYLYFISKWAFRNLHDMLSLLPIMCVFAARSIVELTERKLRTKYLYVVTLLIISPLFYQALLIDARKLKKDTRILAKEWIEKNIPAGSRIGVDWSVFSVPLENDTPFLLRNPIAKKYYEDNLKSFLGKGYQDYLDSKITYKTYELMLWTDLPLWPKDMPSKVIEEAQKYPVYRDLYSRFIFKDIDKVINDEDYVILTSYTWGMFLGQTDKATTNFFNPFIKDRTYLNYAHSKYYIDDKRHGLIFYLIRQGRDFYEIVLNNKSNNFQLIKEFSPGNNLGPIIKIFKVIKNRKL